MGHATDQTPARPSPTERVAALQRQAAADYARAQHPTRRAEARLQLGLTRARASEQAATR